jgi:t-SNARE complex subunit (syntaxin)
MASGVATSNVNVNSTMIYAIVGGAIACLLFVIVVIVVLVVFVCKRSPNDDNNGECDVDVVVI